MKHGATNSIFNPIAIGALAFGLAAAGPATAQENKTLSLSGSVAGNLTLTTDYRFRGVSQTFGDPALQGGVDFTLPSNFYVGTWASVVDKEIFANSRGFEWDIYGGYKWGFADGWTLDVGYLRYEYPGSNGVPGAFVKPNTDEVYAGVSYGPATLKYSYGVSEIFGVIDSEGSDYLELTVNYPIMDKLTLNALVGHQRYAGTQNGFDNSNFDYTVWKLGATYDFGNGFTAGGYWKDTDADPQYFTFKGKEWTKGRAVAFVAWSF